MSLSGLLAAHSHARTSLTDLSYSVRKEIARGEEIVDRVQETRLTPEREPEPVCSCVRVHACVTPCEYQCGNRQCRIIREHQHMMKHAKSTHNNCYLAHNDKCKSDSVMPIRLLAGPPG